MESLGIKMKSLRELGVLIRYCICTVEVGCFLVEDDGKLD